MLSAQAERSVALTMLQVEYQRWQETHLYLLEIATEAGTLLKIGVTARPLTQRITEIQGFLRRQFQHVDVQPRFYVACAPYLEGYFKSKFAAHQVLIAGATEYFRPFPQAMAELQALAQLVAAGIPVPTPQPQPATARPRFRAMFWREHAQHSDFHHGPDRFALLLDVVNLETGERFAEWQLLTFGKQFDALGPLQPGDLVEFDAVVVGDALKRPTKVVRVAL